MPLFVLSSSICTWASAALCCCQIALCTLCNYLAYLDPLVLCVLVRASLWKNGTGLMHQTMSFLFSFKIQNILLMIFLIKDLLILTTTLPMMNNLPNKHITFKKCVKLHALVDLTQESQDGGKDKSRKLWCWTSRNWVFTSAWNLNQRQQIKSSLNIVNYILCVVTHVRVCGRNVQTFSFPCQNNNVHRHDE